jgi:phytoene dehydrogenase-like protein
MGGAIFMTCVGVKGDLAELGMRRANYWAFDTVDVEEVYRDAQRTPPRIHGAYITSGSMKDASAEGHAPEGHHTVEVMTLVGGAPSLWGATDEEALSWSYRRDAGYEQTKQAVEDELLARLEQVVPGVRERAVLVESATPLTHSRFTRATDGTGYGLAATPEQFLQGRPGYRGPVAGLYQCGASTRAGHGIIGAMRSGQNAAHVVLRDLAE